MEDSEAWAEDSVSDSECMLDDQAYTSCKALCISSGSERSAFPASSIEGSDSWITIDAMDLDSEDEKSQREQMREKFKALDLSSRVPSQPDGDSSPELPEEAMEAIEIDSALPDMPSSSTNMLPRTLSGEHRVEDQLLFCSWQGAAFPAHRLDFRASNGLPILDMDATRVFDVLRQEFVRRDKVEHALRLDMLDLALDSWKREGRPGWCLNPQPDDLKFTNPPQAAFNYNQRESEPKNAPGNELQSCFWQSIDWPYYRLYFPMSQGRFDLNVEQARVFDTQEQLFVLGEERNKVLEHLFFAALEDLDKEGHPGWHTDPGWWLLGESQPGQHPNTGRAECLPNERTTGQRPMTAPPQQQCHWTSPAYPGFRLDFPFADGTFVLDLDRIGVYDQSIQGNVADKNQEAEIKQYMLEAALEAWQTRARPGWKVPGRQQQVQAPTPQTQVDNDFYALKLADRDFSKKFFRYWQSPSYPGRRVYFPASQGRPQLEWDCIRVYYVHARRFAENNEEQRLVQMVDLAMQDWDKPQHPNWCFGGEPPQSNPMRGHAGMSDRQMNNSSEAGPSSPQTLFNLFGEEIGAAQML